MSTVVDQPVARAARRRPGALSLGLSRGALELKQFARTRPYLIFTLLFPVLIVLIFGAAFHGDAGGGVSWTQYFVTGMIASGLLATGFQNLAIQIPIERSRGVLKRLVGTPMPRSAYFIGKIVMVLVVSAISTAILLAMAVAFYGLALPDTATKWFTFAWVSLLGVTACTLLGIAYSSLARTGRAAPSMTTPVALVLQFISGVFFVYTGLPGWMQQIAAFFPLKWIAQGLRSVFLPEEFAAREVAHSWELGRVALVLAAWCVAGLILCLLTFRWTDKD
ncbi:ABC transporter permease [Planosporangium flavigriseum]|uniref:Transport permease protein n=1 Tax=Planosporangium flavigriseum TaxID=373681 RepID=A0A8J3LM73_9ACTN|nr:ABC transporter permease [Planosporangium flavigriseum]NJC64244.1 ABC transporter permease [Planosporangium flavigriseum]GIG74272.1 transport permease protein [Planosporangium flavigriseum]